MKQVSIDAHLAKFTGAVINVSQSYKSGDWFRRAHIWFEFKELKTGKWLMHMHADYVPSIDEECTEPYGNETHC